MAVRAGYLDIGTDDSDYARGPAVELLGKGVEISLKKALWRAMHAGRTMFGKKISSLRAFFAAIDEDGGGTVTRRELHAALLRLDVGAQPRQIGRLLQTIDDDSGGDIDFDEFEAWMLRKKSRKVVAGVVVDASEPQLEPAPAPEADANPSAEREAPPEPEQKSMDDKLLQLAIDLGRAVGTVAGASTGLALQRPPANITGVWRAWGDAAGDYTLYLSLRTRKDGGADRSPPLLQRTPTRHFNELFVLQQDADGTIAGKEVPGEPECSFLGHWEGSTVRLKQWYPHLPAACATDWLITPQFSSALSATGGLLAVDRFVGQWTGGCRGEFEAERDDTTTKASAATANATSAGRRLLHTVRCAVRNSDETTVLRWLERAAFVRLLSDHDAAKHGVVSVKVLRNAAAMYATTDSSATDLSLLALLEDGLSLSTRQEEDLVRLTVIAQLIVGWHWSEEDGALPRPIPRHWPVECGVGDDLDGCSLVWLAAEAKSDKILRALLEAGGTPDTMNHKKTTPVHVAAQHFSAAAVSMLLSAARADKGEAAARSLANARNAQGLTALALVCTNPQRSDSAALEEQEASTVVALVQGGADPEHGGLPGRKSPLWLAAAHGHNGVVRALLTCHRCRDPTSVGQDTGDGNGGKGPEVPVNRRICADGCGLSPLLVACQRGHVAVVETLLDVDIIARADAAAGTAAILSAMPSGPGPCVHRNCGNPRQYGDPEHGTLWQQEHDGQVSEPRLLSAGEPWFCKAHARKSDVSLCAWTPYYVACASGQQTVVSLLRERGLGDTADGAQPQSYTRGADLWHQPKVLPRALPEALLPKSRPAIGDLVLLPAKSHPHALGGIGQVVGHYNALGACAVDAPGQDQKITRQTIAPCGTLAEAPPNYVSRPFPAARYQGLGRYYSAGNSLQCRYVMGVSTIAEDHGSKAMTHEYKTIRADPQICWSHLKGYKGKDVATGPMPAGLSGGVPLGPGGPDDRGVGTPIAAWQAGVYVETVRQYPPTAGSRFTPYVPPK